MGKLRDMQLFISVVELGSFAKAAKEAEITPAMIGRRIAGLEDELGFILLNRTTRKMQITHGGQTYYEGCKRILSNVFELEESLTSAYQKNPSGQIKLSAPDGAGASFLIAAIAAFQAEYPDIHFDLVSDNNPQDLVDAQIDLAFRLSFDLQDSALIATKLAETRLALYSSPAYIEKHGTPQSIEALKEHACIHMGASRYGSYWPVLKEGKIHNFRQEWTLTVSTTENLLQALTAGMGIAMVPSLFTEKHLQAGDLIELSRIADFPVVNLYALYPSRKHLPHRVQLFLAFMKEWMKQAF